jgi:hypothetical protein
MLLMSFADLILIMILRPGFAKFVGLLFLTLLAVGLLLGLASWLSRALGIPV